MKCEKCGNGMYSAWGGGTMTTLVGYTSPPGHNHDDNCRTRQYACSCGNRVTVSKRNRCSHPDCDWVGKDECFCHEGKKVENWPDE